jgi:hypothetical protein
MQTMFAIHRRALQIKVLDAKAWKHIANQCSQSVGMEFVKDVENYCIFVEHLSGGPDALFLQDLDRYWKSARVVREMSSKFLADLSKAGTWIARCPDVAIAMVKACLSAPSSFMRNGVADVFTSGDLNLAKGRKHDEVKAAQLIIMKFKELGTKINVVSESAWSRIEGNFAARVVMHIFGKKTPSRKTYESMQHAAIDSFDELKASFGEKMTGVACPWCVVPIAGAKAPSGDELKLNRTMKAVSSGGALDSDKMRSMGFAENVVVTKVDRLKNLKAEFVIKSMEATCALVVPTATPDIAPMRMAYEKLVDYDCSLEQSSAVSIC